MCMQVRHGALLAMLLAASACTPAVKVDAEATSAQAIVHQPSFEEVQTEITTMRERYAQLYASGSTDQLLEIMDDDVYYAGTLQPEWFKGKEALRAEKNRFFGRFPTHRLTFREPQVRVFGEIAIDTGFVGMYMQAARGSPVVTSLRYSMVWVRRPSGWKLANMTADRIPSVGTTSH